jgi:hypothetical protein
MRQKKRDTTAQKPAQPEPIAALGEAEIDPLPALETKTDPHDGLRIVATQMSIRIVDYLQCTRTLAVGESLSFHPTTIMRGKSAHKSEQTEILGFRLAPPSSVLWLDITAETTDGAALTIDTSGILRNAARWGYPTILACASSGAEAGQWTTVRLSQAFTLEAGAHLILIGVGHGIPVDFSKIFPTLAQVTASREPASTRDGHTHAEQ